MSLTAEVARRLLELPSTWARLAWWGLASPKLTERRPLVVVQAVVLDAGSVLLSVRADLRGWELPGGNLVPGESPPEALVREVREETGLDVEIERATGEYRRSGFRPHTALIYRCRVTGGALRTSRETPRVAWFDASALPETLFPWYRQPLADALGAPGPAVRRDEHQGAGSILAGMKIDLRMRCTADGAGGERRREDLAER